MMPNKPVVNEFTESYLLQKIAHGDLDAFSYIYDLYWDDLYRVANFLLKEDELVKDVIHDVFADFWEKRRKVKIQLSLRAYLMVSVRNRCLKTIRKIKLQEGVSLSATEPIYYQHNDIYAQELEHRIDRAMEYIPDKSKQIFKLSREEELSYREIAQKMNLSVKSVEYHISKVLGMLKKVIYIFSLFLIN